MTPLSPRQALVDDCLERLSRGESVDAILASVADADRAWLSGLLTLPAKLGPSLSEPPPAFRAALGDRLEALGNQPSAASARRRSLALVVALLLLLGLGGLAVWRSGLVPEVAPVSSDATPPSAAQVAGVPEQGAAATPVRRRKQPSAAANVAPQGPQSGAPHQAATAGATRAPVRLPAVSPRLPTARPSLTQLPGQATATAQFVEPTSTESPNPVSTPEPKPSATHAAVTATATPEVIAGCPAGTGLISGRVTLPGDLPATGAIVEVLGATFGVGPLVELDGTYTTGCTLPFGAYTVQVDLQLGFDTWRGIYDPGGDGTADEVALDAEHPLAHNIDVLLALEPTPAAGVPGGVTEP